MNNVVSVPAFLQNVFLSSGAIPYADLGGQNPLVFYNWAFHNLIYHIKNPGPAI